MYQPSGDPVQLRSRAGALRREAEALAEREGRLSVVGGIPNNVGDVADRYRAAMESRRARARRSIEQLHALALKLDRSADQLEQQLLEYQAHLQSSGGNQP